MHWNKLDNGPILVLENNENLTGGGGRTRSKVLENRLVVIKNNPYSFYLFCLSFTISNWSIGTKSKDIILLESDNGWFTCPVLHRRYVNHLPGIIDITGNYR